MTPDIFRRMLWKEFRMLRGFWLMLVAVVLGGQFIAWIGGSRTEGYYAIAAIAVVLYTLGVSAMVFAVEREEGTDTFLEALPVRSRQLFTPKVLLAAGSAVALASVLLAYTWLVCRYVLSARVENVPPAGSLSMLAFVALYALEALVWGLFFSLVVRRPIVAACLAAVAAIVTPLSGLIASGLIAAGLNAGTNRPPQGDFADNLPAMLGFFAIMAVVFVVDVGLGMHWLEGWRAGARSRSLAPRMRSGAAATGARVPAQTSLVTEFWRLAWQLGRANARLMTILVGIGVLLCVWFGIYGYDAKEKLTVVAPVAIALAAVMGSCVFLTDQERSQFRFFAERPVRPRMVWLNRQVVWLTVTMLTYSIAAPVWVWSVFGNLSELFHRPYGPIPPPQLHRLLSLDRSLQTLPNWSVFLALVFMAYCCGQLCSMLFRSAIIAAFLAIVLTLALSLWLALTSAMGVGWLISYLPIPIILLWATWLRTPDWIGERTGWRPWARVALSLVGPALVMKFAVVAFRVWQIPVVDAGFSPAAFAAQVTPAARATADMYGRATASGEDSLPLLLAATAQSECVFPLSARGALAGKWDNLLRRIRAEAKLREEAGDLDAAFDCYLALLRMSTAMRRHQFVLDPARAIEHQTLDALATSWVTRTEQTSDRIVRSIKALATWERTIPLPDDAIEAHYEWASRLLALEPDALAEQKSVDRDQAKAWGQFVFLSTLFPWETTRARRGLNYVTAAEINSFRTIERTMQTGQPVSQLAAAANWTMSDHLVLTTPWLGLILSGAPLSPAIEWPNDRTMRSFIQLRLALEAYRIDHGQLPEDLAALVGKYIDEIPRDPYAGQPILYYAYGMPSDVLVMTADRSSVPHRTPFLWSCGPSLMPLGGGMDYRVVDPRGNQQYSPLSRLDAVPNGWAYPVPPAVVAPRPQPALPAAEDERADIFAEPMSEAPALTPPDVPESSPPDDSVNEPYPLNS